MLPLLFLPSLHAGSLLPPTGLTRPILLWSLPSPPNTPWPHWDSAPYPCSTVTAVSTLTSSLPASPNVASANRSVTTNLCAATIPPQNVLFAPSPTSPTNTSVPPAKGDPSVPTRPSDAPTVARAIKPLTQLVPPVLNYCSLLSPWPLRSPSSFLPLLWFRPRGMRWKHSSVTFVASYFLPCSIILFPLD